MKSFISFRRCTAVWSSGRDRFVCMCWRGCWAWAECRLHLMTHLILDNSSPWTQGLTANLILRLATVRPRGNVKIKCKELMNIFKKSKVTVHSESSPPFPKPSGPSMNTTREISLCPISPFSSIPLATSSYPYLTLLLLLLSLNLSFAYYVSFWSTFRKKQISHFFFVLAKK